MNQSIEMRLNTKQITKYVTLFSGFLLLILLAFPGSAIAATQTATLTGSTSGLNPNLSISFTDIAGPGTGTQTSTIYSIFGTQVPPFNITNNEVFSHGQGGTMAGVPNFRWDISHSICSAAKLQSLTIDSKSTVNDFSSVTNIFLQLILTNTTTNTAYSLASVTGGYPAYTYPTDVVLLPNPAEASLPGPQQSSFNTNVVATWDLANSSAVDSLAIGGLYNTGNELDTYKINSVTITYDDSACTQQLVAVDDITSTTPNNPVKFKVTDNDTNNSGGTLSVTHIDGVAVVIGQEVVLSDGSGTAVLSADGEITFTPSANFKGVARIPYTVTSSTGSTASAVLSVTVSANPPNTGFSEGNSRTILRLPIFAAPVLLLAFRRVRLYIKKSNYFID